MKIAITGKPFVGKTTIFKAITGVSEDLHLIDKPNVGTVKVPDPRLDFLSEVFQPKKTTYAEIVFADFVGFENVSNSMEKYGAAINQLKTTDAMAIVCKLFDQDKNFSPSSDIENWQSELLLADLQIIENRLERINKLSKGKKNPLNENEKKLLFVCKDCIESGKPLRSLELGEDEKKLLRGFQMLSIKPVIAIYNIPETSLGKAQNNIYQSPQLKACPDMTVTTICGEMELEIFQLEKNDRKEFMKEMDIDEPGLNKLIRTAYDQLGLISFFTVGKDEVKAWTIRKNTAAVMAAGAIHSDIEKGFIRAQIISFKDFKSCGSLSEGKNKGLVKLEGKNYIVQDGDIIEFRFNV